MNCPPCYGGGRAGRHEGNARDKSMRRGFLAGWFRFPKVNPRARGNPAEFNAQKSSNGENSDVLYMHEIRYPKCREREIENGGHKVLFGCESYEHKFQGRKNKVVSRLCELASLTRGSLDAEANKLGSTFLGVPVWCLSTR